jgi:hypothetical protein
MVRKPRIDHKKNLAMVILSIAKGIDTVMEITTEIGLDKRTTFNLLKELEENGHIGSDRPQQIHNHPTKKLRYNLLDDPWNFSYYMILINENLKEKIEEFMLTKYYGNTASTVCRIVSEHVAPESLFFGLYVLRTTEKKGKNRKQDSELVLAMFTKFLTNAKNPEILNNVFKDLEREGFELFLDPLNKDENSSIDIETIKRLIYGNMYGQNEAYFGNSVIDMETMKRLHDENMTEQDKTYFKNLTSKDLEILRGIISVRLRYLGLENKDLFDKALRAGVITRAALSEHLFYDAFYKTITTFPDSAIVLCKSLLSMISRTMPEGYKEDNLDLLFGWSSYAKDGGMTPAIQVVQLEKSLHYIIIGDIVQTLLVKTLIGINYHNAIMPEQFLEGYILDEIEKN